MGGEGRAITIIRDVEQTAHQDADCRKRPTSRQVHHRHVVDRAKEIVAPAKKQISKTINKVFLINIVSDLNVLRETKDTY